MLPTLRVSVRINGVLSVTSSQAIVNNSFSNRQQVANGKPGFV